MNDGDASRPVDASTLTRLREYWTDEDSDVFALLKAYDAQADRVAALEAALEKVAALALDHHDGPSRRAALLGIFIAARAATGDNE